MPMQRRKVNRTLARVEDFVDMKLYDAAVTKLPARVMVKSQTPYDQINYDLGTSGTTMILLPSPRGHVAIA